MAVTAQFIADGKTTEFTDVPGYRISFCVTPGASYQGHFYVYLADRVTAREAFTAKVEPGDETQVGTLIIKGDLRSYQLDQIELYYADTIINNRERVRIVCFKYGRQLTENDPLKAQFSNKSKQEIQKGPLHKHYRFSLAENDNETLAGFRLFNGAEFDTVLRFSSLRNPENSWITALIKMNDHEVKEKEPWSDLKITFSQGTVTVKHEELRHAFIDESYGLFLDYPLPTMKETAQNALPEMAQFVVPEYSSRDLLDFIGRMVEAQTQRTETMETATFVMKGVYRTFGVV